MANLLDRPASLSSSSDDAGLSSLLTEGRMTSASRSSPRRRRGGFDPLRHSSRRSSPRACPGMLPEASVKGSSATANGYMGVEWRPRVRTIRTIRMFFVTVSTTRKLLRLKTHTVSCSTGFPVLFVWANRQTSIRVSAISASARAKSGAGPPGGSPKI